MGAQHPLTGGETEAQRVGLPQGLWALTWLQIWTAGSGRPNPADRAPQLVWLLCDGAGRSQLRRAWRWSSQGGSPSSPGPKCFQTLLCVALSVPLIRLIHPEPVSPCCVCLPGGGGGVHSGGHRLGQRGSEWSKELARVSLSVPWAQLEARLPPQDGGEAPSPQPHPAQPRC